MDLAKAIVLLMLVQLQTSPAWGCSSGSRTYRFFIADERSVLTEVVWCTERCTILIFGASQDFRPKDRPGRYLIAELRRFAVLTRTRQRLIHVDLHLEVRNDRKLDFAMAHFEVPIESVVYLYSGKSGFVERT